MLRSITFSRGVSESTIAALQYLVSHPNGDYVQNIADSINAPYNSTLKLLLRLEKHEVLRHPERGFFTLNHDDPIKVSTYLRKCHFVGVGGGLGLCLHGVGLVFDVPGLWGCLRGDVGLVRKRNWYPFRSVVFGASVRLYRESVYFQWKAPPFSSDDLVLFYEDGLKTLDYVTGGLAKVKGAWLNDYELGFDRRFDMLLFNYMKMKKIVTYPKKGYIRKHIQFNKKALPLPLDQDTITTMHTDLLTTMTEEERLLEHIFNNKLNP